MPSRFRSLARVTWLCAAAWTPLHAQDTAPPRTEEPPTQHAAHPWFEALWAEHQPAWMGLPGQAAEDADRVGDAAQATVEQGVGPWPGVPAVPARVRNDLGDAASRADVLRRPGRAWGLAGGHVVRAHGASVEAARGGVERAHGGVEAAREDAEQSRRAWLEDRRTRMEDLETADHDARVETDASLADVRARRDARVLDAGVLLAMAWPGPASQGTVAHARLWRAMVPSSRALMVGGWRDGAAALRAGPAVLLAGSRTTSRHAVDEMGLGVERARLHTGEAAAGFRAARDEGALNMAAERAGRGLRVAAWRDNMAASRKSGARELALDVRTAQASTSANMGETVGAAWAWGWDGHARGGARLAGDNAFAGDVEGALLAAWYGTSSVLVGSTTVGALVPMAVCLHGSIGAAWLAALGTRAVVGRVALDAADVGGTAGTWLDGTRRELGALHAGLLGMGGALGEGAVRGTWDVVGAGLGAAWVTARGVGQTSRAAVVESVLPSTTAALEMTGALLFPLAGLPAAHASVALATVARTVTPLVGAAAVLGMAGLVFGAGSTAIRVGHGMRFAAWHAGTAAAIAVTGGARATGALLAGVVAAVTAWTWVMVVAPLHVGVTWAGAALRVVRDLVVRPWAAALSFPVILLGGVLSAAAVLAAAGAQLGGGMVMVAAGVAWGTAHHGTATALSGAARSADAATAPFQLDRLLAWRAERTPQVQEMLERQPDDVRRRVGTRLEYVRVIAAGPDRGKVAFFDVRNDDGLTRRLHRSVRADGVLEFVDAAGTVLVDSGWTVAASTEVP